METTRFFKHVPNFSLQDWKCKETKTVEECWAKTQVVGQSYCRPSASSVLGFSFQPLTCTHTHIHTYIAILGKLSHSLENVSVFATLEYTKVA